MSEVSSKVKNTGELLGWLCSRMFFLVIVDLSALGAYQCYNWYQTQQPIQIDIAQLSADERAELSKQIFLAGQEEHETKKHR